MEIYDDITTVFATHETFDELFAGRVSENAWSSLALLLEPLRMKKSDEEIEVMRKAIDITHEAYRAIRNNLSKAEYEYHIESYIAQVFRLHHATEAYPSIVASGKNATILHYTQHSMRLSSKDLLLVDFGAEYK